MIATLLREETLRTGVGCRTWQEAVDLAGGPLVSDGTIDRGYLEAAKAAVHEFGPYMAVVDGVALFHARPESGAHRVGLSLALLPDPVDLEGKPVTVAFVLAAPDAASHVGLMRELATGLMDEAFVELMRTNGSRAEILREVQRLENADEEH